MENHYILKIALLVIFFYHHYFDNYFCVSYLVMCFCLNLVVLQLVKQNKINESPMNKDNDDNNKIGVEIQQHLPPTTDDDMLPIGKLNIVD
jgi:hypothetical protein